MKESHDLSKCGQFLFIKNESIVCTVDTHTVTWEETLEA